MRDKGMVVSIDKDNVTIIPLITDACLSCNAGCAKRGKPFQVVNTRNLPVANGSIVRIASSRSAQALQGIISLLFPFACAVIGYFIATPAAAVFNKTAGDGLHALFVLLFLFISSLIVFLISRKIPFPGKPEITEIC